MRRYYSLLLLLGCATTLHAQPSAFHQTGIGGGGALFQPTINPLNSSEIWIACDMSDEFHSTDFGATWNVTDFRQFQSSNLSGHIQYGAGTNGPGSILYAVNAMHETPAPYKSTDGGLTWQPLTDPTGGGAYSIAADPDDATHLVLSDYGNLYFSTDGGGSFTKIYTAISNASGCHVAGTFFDGQNIYIATNDGLIVSSNGGQSFSRSSVQVPAGEYIVSFAGAKQQGGNQQGTVRFFCVTLNEQWAGITGAEHPSFRGVYEMNGPLSAWTKCTMPANDQPFFVAMAKGDISTAYVAGGSSGATPTVVRTTDGGTNWTDVFLTANNTNIATGWSGANGDRAWSYGEYALGLAVAPSDPKRIVITDLGFAHVSSDGGATWHQAYVAPKDENPAGSSTPKGRSYHSSGIDNTTCWRVMWADSLNMVACFSDIQGILSSDGGDSWNLGYTGDNFNTMSYALKHPQSNVIYALVSSVHDLYQSTRLQDATLDAGKGQILFSTNQGKGWQVLHDFGHPVFWLAADPTNAHTLYASVINSTSGGIYRSDNIQDGAASTWIKLTSPPRTEGHPATVVVLNDGSVVTTFSGRRDKTGHFTASSGVFYSADRGTTWIDRSSANMNYWTKDVVIDPHDPTQSTWYVGVFSGWGGGANNLGGLFRTTNKGVNWTALSPTRNVTSLTVSPGNKDEAYYTTENEGLWHTNNLSATTPDFTQIMSYPFRQPERVFYNPYDSTDIWVTSFGNGMRHSGSNATAPSVTIADAQLAQPSDKQTNVLLTDTLVVQPVANAESYEFIIGTDPALAGSPISSPANRFFYFGLKSGTTYYWKARGVRTSGSLGVQRGAWSPLWSFTTKMQAAVTEAQTLGAAITLYPNPATNRATISLTLAKPERVRIEVHATSGEQLILLKDELLGQGTQEIRWDLANLPSGDYFIRIETSDQHVTRPVTVIH